ncbi:hypothetical protein, partial [Streptomyces kanasensis]|uniref:hypothetical protein n=1 Tax=Streptomyces kanasensis TaxID=936756 RepID=UPI001E50D490
FPVTNAEEGVIHALAKWPIRLGSMNPRISIGFHEKNDRAAGYFDWNPTAPENWEAVILQGSFIGVATPYAKQPPVGGSKSMRDYAPWDHLNLPFDAVPRTNYQRKASVSKIHGAAGALVRRFRVFCGLRKDPESVGCFSESSRQRSATRGFSGNGSGRCHQKACLFTQPVFTARYSDFFFFFFSSFLLFWRSKMKTARKKIERVLLLR